MLPLFTSLLNVVFAYDPVGMGMPYNHVFFSDSRGPLINVALQVLIVCLDGDAGRSGSVSSPVIGDVSTAPLDVSLVTNVTLMKN